MKKIAIINTLSFHVLMIVPNMLISMKQRKIMKNIYIVFLTASMSISLQAMNKYIFPPDDILSIILINTSPDIQNCLKNPYSLQKFVNDVCNIQCVCKKSFNALSIKKVAHLLNITDENKNILLFNAAQIGSPGLIQLAIDHKADSDFVYKIDLEQGHCMSYTSLFNAVGNDHYRSCLQLLKAGADIKIEAKTSNSGLGDYQPIHLAKKKNILELLLEYGADINAKGYEEETPLEKAMICQNFPLIKVLIKHGAEKPRNEYVKTIKHLLDSGYETNLKYLNQKKRDDNNILLQVLFTEPEIEKNFYNSAYNNIPDHIFNTIFVYTLPDKRDWKKYIMATVQNAYNFQQVCSFFSRLFSIEQVASRLDVTDKELTRLFTKANKSKQNKQIKTII